MPQSAATFRLSFALPDEAATAALARRLAPLARRGDVIALAGDLGAGKTAFARAFVNALPGPPEEVPSPTFTLVQSYRRNGLELWHFDLYRLKSAEEAWELGLEEALAEGVSLIEWPERLGASLPPGRLELVLTQEGNGRRAALVGHGDWPERLAGLAGDPET